MSLRLHAYQLMCVCCLIVSGLIFSSLIVSCSKSADTPAATDPSWQTHIADFPKRWVQAEKPLFIRFTHPVVAADKLEKPIDGVVKLSPDIPASIVFTADNELRITPAERLKSDFTLKVTLYPDKLLGVDKKLKPFVFEAHSIKQEFDVKVQGLLPQENATDTMQLVGELRSADTLMADQLPQILKTQINGVEAALTWTHSDDKLTHGFVLKDIKRTQQTGNLHLTWDGASIGVADKGARDLEIPAINAFIITGVQVVREPSLHVEINFSDSLNTAQNMQGLVTLGKKNYSTKVNGSQLLVYPEGIGSGPQELVVAETVKSSEGKALGKEYHQSLVLVLQKPSISFVGKNASILPPAEHLTVPIEAAGVDSVQVVAFKVYANNMGHFFQRYNYGTTEAASADGRYLWRKTFQLPETTRDNPKRFNLDLTELMAKNPDGLVRLEIQIDRSNSVYACDKERPKDPVNPMPKNKEDGSYYDEDSDEPEWYRQYYESEGYINYSEYNNPCTDSYYRYGNSTSAARIFMVSNIGLMAKRGADNKLHVLTTSLNTAEPLSGAEIAVYNYQQQVIGQGTTDSYGMVDVQTEGVPFFVQATKDKQFGYLRVPKNEALPTNQFDVSGEHVKEGIKGFMYGERDVWRPGDDIYLTFILQDKDNRFPENYPVSMDLFDPQGKKVFSQTNVTPVDDFYPFTLKTEEQAPTGNYRAVAHVGSRYFDKVIKVEMVTPNRLKIDLNFDEPKLTSANMPQTVHLFSQWLHGATANSLKADSEVKLFSKKTVFAGFEQYVFDDPSRTFEVSSQKVFDGNLNAEGKANFELNLETNTTPPGMLQALFNTRVFEESGNFSTALRSYDFAPFDSWVGLNVPKGGGYNNAIARNNDHEIYFQSLNDQGKASAKRNIEVTVYELGWRWWWDEGEDDIASYMGNSSHTPVQQDKLVTDANGKAVWKLKKDTYDWGRHLIRVCDTKSQHCAGQVVYLGWDWNASKNPESATQLMLSTDKEKYQVGDTAKIKLPKTVQGRVLLSVENGSRVLSHRWLDLSPNQTEFTLPITAEYAPNAYVNITLLLPHKERKSDSPMRLYGVVPLLVEDPTTHLQPQLDVADKVRPESKFNINVSEKNGHAMTYSLVMVDEGLLGLTGFTAPDPHANFYKREALGVLTWDMFDAVVGAYGASLERVLAIGGSDAAQDAERKRRERRFPPIVKYLGAFHLNAGETRKHEIQLPPYMGAVRVMLVAGDTQKVPAYGKVEKTVTVTQPLVLFATLPRVLGPSEEVLLPVNVFAGDSSVKKVTIQVEANEMFSLLDKTAELNFDKPGDAITSLRVKVNDRLGTGRVKVIATSGAEKAEQEIYIAVRPANPPTVVYQSKLLAPGEEWASPVETHGLIGTNQASVEVSTLPPLNLEKRLAYLIEYPHGCVEQTTSAIFPQLRLGQLVTLNQKQKTDIDNNIQAGIKRLTSFQAASGGFSYWPGDGYVNDWASSYAGHFLVEAKRAGYALPANMLDNWVKYQTEQARNVEPGQREYTTEVAAYRLYTLALADKAEMSAMNRLREYLLQYDKDVAQTARWLLGAAYLQVGIKDAAKDLMVMSAAPLASSYYDYSYGSELRSRAVMLSALAKSDQVNAEATWQLAEQVAGALASDEWYSTHSTSWGLLAMSDFAVKRKAGSGMKFSVKEAGASDWKKLQATDAFYKQNLTSPKVVLRNDSTDSNLRVLVSSRGVPAAMDESASSNGLKMDVQFLGIDKKPLDVQKLPQGTDFVAEVTVTSEFTVLTGNHLENIALSMIMPSGWQIRNERLEGNANPKGIDYMDIRDDRVLSYFSLWRDYYWSYRYQDRNQTSVTLRVILNASYAGKYYLPSWQVAPMYNEKIHAKTKGYWVEVVKK